MVSVRAALDPLNTALGRRPIYFVQASFAGLPLINQALAALHPPGGGSYPVTVRNLIQVIESIPSSKVVQAVADETPPAPRPTPTPAPKPGPTPAPAKPPKTPPKAPQATCGAELDTSNPGTEAVTYERVYGSGYLPTETVNVIENGNTIASTNADSLGQFSVSVGYLIGAVPTPHTVHAQGMKSGRVSNTASFTT